MSNLLKTGFLLGLGAAVSSKEKVEKYIDDLVSKGRVTPQEADDMYHSLLKKGEETEEKWNTRSKEKVGNFIEDLNLVSKDDYKLLQARVELLEEKLSNLEKQDKDSEIDEDHQ
ncbi:phasin family protein [Salipaludibacillus sp. CF4.18]|uniref:phasin family protein n=1 Tax=Salipaludibacillus sp. CF4.18 TaxID=3373081 RepID=UPI003EE722C4